MAKVAKPTSRTPISLSDTTTRPVKATSPPLITGEGTVITKGSPKLPDNPTPLPTMRQLMSKTATPNVIQANTSANTNLTQNAPELKSPVGDNEATRTIFKQLGNPVVGIRDFTASKGYANAVDWDGENVTIGGQIVKPMYVKDGTAYADTDSVLEAIKAYENQNGIISNKDVLKKYEKDIQPQYNEALTKLLDRPSYDPSLEKNEALNEYIKFNRKQADLALRKVLNDNNASLPTASGAVLSQAMAARDSYLDKLKNEYIDYEQKNYERYRDNYDMKRNDLSDIMKLGNDYYDKLYSTNRDAVTDTRTAGETERKDQQQWYENSIANSEQGRKERELALKEVLSPLEVEKMNLSNKGLGLENTSKELKNEGLGIENSGLVLKNEELGLKNKGLELENTGLTLKNEETALKNEETALKNEGLKESNRDTALQNREKEAIRRGFWTYEDEAYFPWLSNYRNSDGTYRISPYYGEAMYNYLTAGASAQGTLDAQLGLYSPALKQYMRR